MKKFNCKICGNCDSSFFYSNRKSLCKKCYQEIRKRTKYKYIKRIPKENWKMSEKNKNAIENYGKELTCTICFKTYVYLKEKCNSLKVCTNCMVNDRRIKLKIKMVEYKGGKCEICGYNKCMRALSFHHLNPSEKDFTVSGKHCRKWQAVKQELDKCQLLCMNCHAEVHEDIDNQRKLSEARTKLLNVFNLRPIE